MFDKTLRLVSCSKCQKWQLRLSDHPRTISLSLSRVLFSITSRLPRDARMIPPESSRERLEAATAVLPLRRELVEARRSKTGSIKTRASDLDREAMTMATIERTTRGRHRHWRRDRQAVSSARLHLTRRARRRPHRPFANVRTRLPHPSVSPAPPFADNRTDDPECPNIATATAFLFLSFSPSLARTRTIWIVFRSARDWRERETRLRFYPLPPIFSWSEQRDRRARTHATRSLRHALVTIVEVEIGKVIAESWRENFIVA